MNQTNKKEQTYTSAKRHQQYLNTNFNVPVIERSKLPQLFAAPPIQGEG